MLHGGTTEPPNDRMERPNPLFGISGGASLCPFSRPLGASRGLLGRARPGTGPLPLQRSGEGGGPEIGAAAREESGVAASARLEVQWQAAEPLSVKDFPASGMNFQV